MKCPQICKICTFIEKISTRVVRIRRIRRDALKHCFYKCMNPTDSVDVLSYLPLAVLKFILMTIRRSPTITADSKIENDGSLCRYRQNYSKYYFDDACFNGSSKKIKLFRELSGSKYHNDTTSMTQKRGLAHATKLKITLKKSAKIISLTSKVWSRYEAILKKDSATKSRRFQTFGADTAFFWLQTTQRLSINFKKNACLACSILESLSTYNPTTASNFVRFIGFILFLKCIFGVCYAKKD